MSRRYAFVTLITSDTYLPGALAVAAALREVHPSPPVDPEVPFQTVCIVTPETVDVKTIKHLRKAFDLVIGVEVIGAQTAAELHLLGRPDLHSVLTKLHVFRFTQFDKIILLDADVLPIRPLSHLFTLPHEFSAVPDVGWPDIFNSGMMVLTPGEDKFSEIMNVLKSKGSWDGGDQGVLNEWRGSNWNRLSFTYNTTPTAAYTYAPAYERFGSQISAIHFIGENKPWNEIPYRAPSSASQVHQQQISSFQLASAVPPGQLTASTSTAPLQSYAYSSLVDRWFDVYDRNYRRLVAAPEPNFEAQRYENVWDDSSAGASEIAPAGAFGLEDLRRLALEGGTSTSCSAGEGEYRRLPLEGRVDLMRPRQELTKEPVLAESRDGGERSQTPVPSEDHVRTPTVEQPQWLGHAPSTERHVSTPGPHEVPASPLLAPLPLPPSGSVSPVPISHGLLHDQEVMGERFSSQAQKQPEAVTTTVMVEQPAVSRGPPYQTVFNQPEVPRVGVYPDSNLRHPFAQEGSQTQDHHHAPPGEPRRPASPPVINWNPAVEPPPNVPPTPSTFPTDAYFPNAWDLPNKPHEVGSTISSQFFEAPSQAQIPQQLIKEGHYKDVTGPQEDTSPQPDLSKVTTIFPWEQKPRHIPGRVFPEGELAPPGIQYIENLPLTEPEHESELSTPDTTYEERVQVASPQGRFPSPPSGLAARGFVNVWDSVPSIQKYAARLVKPAVAAAPLTIPPPRMRRRTDSYRSRSEHSDANSMDGDVEDEIDDIDSDVDAGGRFSSSERSSGRGSRRGSKVVVGSPPSGMSRSRIGKKEYRSYGVQTVPKEVRSIAVQVSQEISMSAGKSGGKDVPEPEPTAISSSAMPHIELAKQSTAHESLIGPEPSALATPTSANVASFMRGPAGHQQHVTPSGMVSPRLQEPYSVPSPSQTPQDMSPGTQSPPSQKQIEKMKPLQISTEQPQLAPSIVVRTSSQETADSPLGPVSPVDASQSRKPARRRWNPATGLDVFKRSSEEVLARFLRLGSWEDDSHSPAHTTA